MEDRPTVSTTLSALPAWVYKRDGRLVPFETDSIAQALFAAAEKLGRADAFLAHELTGSVLHFLAEEMAGTIPTTVQIREVAAKVVRELGHPALARMFLAESAGRTNRTAAEAERTEGRLSFSLRAAPAAVVQNCLRSYSLQTLCSRDLVAAQEDGLITMYGLHHPLHFSGCVVSPGELGNTDSGLSWLLPAILQAREVAGQFVSIDGPEYPLNGAAGSQPQTAALTRELELALKTTGLRAVLQLNCATPPVWAADGAQGPLFVHLQQSLPGAERAARAEILLEQCLSAESLHRQVWVEWHLDDKDFQSAGEHQRPARLCRLARWALECPRLAFTFDRSKRPITLGPGLDRRAGTLLLAVGLHLPRLTTLPGVAHNPEIFLQKMSSLVRLAISAACQKRAFLRDRARSAAGELLPVNRQFLLTRARILVFPLGLEEAVRCLMAWGPAGSKLAASFAGKIVQHLREALHSEARRASLEICLGGAGPVLLAEDGPTDAATPARAPEAAAPDITLWDAAVPLSSQLRAASALHAQADMAAATLLLAPEHRLGIEEVADLLHLAWKETAIHRLQFQTLASQQQLLLPGI